MEVWSHLGKINVVTLFLTHAYGLLFTRGDGNHLWNIEIITRGLRPLVINSIFHSWLPSPLVNNNPYAFVKSKVTSQCCSPFNKKIYAYTRLPPVPFQTFNQINFEVSKVLSLFSTCLNFHHPPQQNFPT